MDIGKIDKIWEIEPDRQPAETPNPAPDPAEPVPKEPAPADRSANREAKNGRGPIAHLENDREFHHACRYQAFRSRVVIREGSRFFF